MNLQLDLATIHLCRGVLGMYEFLPRLFLNTFRGSDDRNKETLGVTVEVGWRKSKTANLNV